LAEKKPSYYELLTHPQWQRKRLEVLQVADFRCSKCGSDEKTLHVHHSYYEKGLKPWEYPTKSLHALCADCHRTAQDWMQLLHRQIGKLHLLDIETLYGFALAVGLDGPSRETVVEVQSFAVAQGIAFALHTNPGFVLHHVRDGVVDLQTLIYALLTERI
jgi:hypothetical protein